MTFLLYVFAFMIGWFFDELAQHWAGRVLVLLLAGYGLAAVAKVLA